MPLPIRISTKGSDDGLPVTCVSDANKSFASTTSISRTPIGNGDFTSRRVSKGTSGRVRMRARFGSTKLSWMTCTMVFFNIFTICLRKKSNNFMSLAISICRLGKSMQNNCRFPNRGSKLMSGANMQEAVPRTSTPTTEMLEISMGTPAGPWPFNLGLMQNSGPEVHTTSASTCIAGIPLKFRDEGRRLVIRGGTLPGSNNNDTSSMVNSGKSEAAVWTASSIFSVPFRMMNCRA
mmetsp:Transcript_60128/g.143305  ORF Transcript_60128/g.143305 Transcript_60128/m.143305 type:complete len:235 (+) Transcript_60128:1505-2209(+)